MTFSGLALADNIQDDIADVGSGVTLTAGSSTGGTAKIRVVGNSSQQDPDAGCNFDTATEFLDLTINAPAGVIATPSTLHFTSCGVDQSVSFTAASDAAAGTRVATATITNNATNGTFQNSVNIPITVTRPNTKPTLTLPSDISTASTVVTYTATANDAEDGALTPTCTPASGSTFALGTTTVNCSVTDKGGLTTTGSFTVTVTDGTAPTLTLPQDISVDATGAGGEAVTFQASATDAVDGSVPVTCNPASGSTFAVGTTTVNCSATDTAGNQASGSFTVTVADKTAPQLTLPADISLGATATSGATATYVVSATDTIDGPVPVTCNPASGSTFAVGTTTVNCSATDTAGNQAGGSFTVTVSDKTAPVFTLPSNPTAEADGPNGAAVSYEVSATDTIDGPVPVTCDPASGSTFAVGATTVDCEATDEAGNTATGSFTVTVTDTTAPVLDLPKNITDEANGSDGSTVTFTATADDAVDGSVPVTCTPPSGSTFAVGTTTVNCEATDEAGNTANGSFTVTITDTTAPVLDLPEDITTEAQGSDGTMVTFTGTAKDAVDGPAAVTCTPPSGSTFAVGTTTVNCEATDKAGNRASGSFTVTITDTTAPALTLPSVPTTEATGASGAFVTYAVSATDTVDGSVPVTCTPPSGSTFAVGTTTVNCEATDEAGNKATGSFTVTVADTTAPEITIVGGPANGGSYYFGSVPAAPTCSATDLVSGTVPCTVSGYGSAVGKPTITATATDGAGNKATKTGASYTVQAWTTKGFFQPIDMGGTANSAKAGSTIPVKFELFAASELTDVSAVQSIKYRSISCTSLSGAADEIETLATATGGTALRYDSTAGQFVYNWKTPAAGCYQLTLLTGDGLTSITANFNLRK